MLYFENKKIEESPLVKCLGECCFCNISDFFNCSDDTDKYNEMYLFSASFLYSAKELLDYCNNHMGKSPLHENVIVLINGKKIDYKRYYFPYTICYLLYHALELYLKACLLQFNIIPPEKHDLTLLWDKLKELHFKHDNITNEIVNYIDKSLNEFKLLTDNGLALRYPFKTLKKNPHDYFEINGIDPYKIYYIVSIIMLQLQELKSDELDRKIPNLFDKLFEEPLISLKQQEEQHENNPI